MATTDYDFLVTRSQIAERALRIVGGLAQGEVINGDQSTAAILALNSLVKSWQNKHVFLWTVVPITKTLTASVDNFSVSTDPMVIGIERAFIRVNGFDMDVQVISWREYLELSNKAITGQPLQCAFKQSTTTPSIYLYPVPSTGYTFIYDAIVRLKDLDATSTNPDFPPTWYEALTYGLAAQLADEYGLPISEREYLTGKAEQLFLKAKQSDDGNEEIEFIKSAY